MRFADPKNDVAFKKIFGDENKTEVLISFLNSILDFKGTKQIQSLTILNPYQIEQLKDYKNTVLDVRAINQDKEEFIVEMQVAPDLYFAKRSLYYSSKSYTAQLKKAEQYHTLKKVYFIGILDFKMFDSDEFLSRHLILNEKTLKNELQDMEFNFIELEKFNLELNQCDTIAKKWIYFIQNASSFELIPSEYKNLEEFKTAFNTAQMHQWKDKEVQMYDSVSMQKGIRINEIKTAEIKGIEQGIEQGKYQEKLEIAKNSISQGLDDKTIAMITGLDISTIQKLR